MYKEKIIASLNNLAEGELKALWERIQFDFVPDIGEKSMLRDDIRDRLFELLLTEFSWRDENLTESTSFLDKDTTIDEAIEFSEVVSREFEIRYINPDAVSKWTQISKIINYIEDTLECALHDIKEQ